MKIAMIAAMAANRVIGKDNKMPWHLPEELGYFKRVTMGKPVIMGRKTFESIGRPLPGRKNIVLSSNPGFRADGVTLVTTLEEALAAAGECDEVMIIGGARLYQQMLPKAERLYLTQIEVTVDGDAFFPEYQDFGWHESASELHVSSNGTRFSTHILERIKDCPQASDF